MQTANPVKEVKHLGMVGEQLAAFLNNNPSPCCYGPETHRARPADNDEQKFILSSPPFHKPMSDCQKKATSLKHMNSQIPNRCNSHWAGRLGRLARMGLRAGIAAFTLLVLGAPGSSHASTAWGSINNFDVVNDTGRECHGFEIEIEDIHSSDITYTYDWNHYGTPRIIEDNSNPSRPRVIVRYESARTNGGWAAYTAIPSGPIVPTDGHRFTNPSINMGGEHFGVGYRTATTNIAYFWLVDDGTGNLVRGPAVMVATPTFTYFPAQVGAPAQVQAVIEPPPEPPVKEFGVPTWVKEIRTTTHNNREVKLRDLVTDDPDDPGDRDWRNGEPDEVEIEWQLLQREFKKVDGGARGKLAGAPEDLPHGDEVITRRYEFYEYVGPLDDESGEAKADRVGPDGIHGIGVKPINGVDVDLSTVEVVGEYLGAQMSAFDVAAPAGLIEHLQDGIAGEPYPARTIVIAGATPFVSTNWGNLPAGMSFDPVSGAVSGTPATAGVYQFTVEAQADGAPVMRRTYTLTIAEDAAAADALPPRSTVDTIASPLNGGVTTGDGVYTNGTIATVTATPADSFAFLTWSENGKVVSRSPSYTFTNAVHRSLVASFVALPRLSVFAPEGGPLTLAWPTNFSGFLLQQSSSLTAADWAPVTNVSSVHGSAFRVTVPEPAGNRFFRLLMRNN